MTNPAGPSGLTPGQWGLTGTDGSIPNKATHTQGNVTQTLQDQFTSQQFSGLGSGLIALVLSFIGAGIAAILGGFATVIEAIFGTVNDSYVAALPIITDHSQSINDLRQAFDQLVLQGNALVFPSNGTYTPSPEATSVDVIIIAAGAGGAAGRAAVNSSDVRTGGGGGGGGEVHYSLPAALLPRDGVTGDYLPIAITIGAGGAGGSTDAAPGVGGGNSSFGTFLIAGGGTGGQAGVNGAGGPGGPGGSGMIPGGDGGKGGGASDFNPSAAGGNSTSPYDLYGGGGGGGGGASANYSGMPGGTGGISPGGAPSANGTAPAQIIATGGGGGGGGGTVGASGGAGAYPAGGGGGGGGGGVSGAHGFGGNGGNGIVYVIERTT